MKVLLDDLVQGAELSVLVGLAAALAAVGIAMAVIPLVSQYLHAELDRRTGVAAMDQLFGAVDRFVGITRFEDPRFLDELRLAQAASRSAPLQIVSGGLDMAGQVLPVLGFAGSLFVLSPVMALMVLVAAVPTVIAEGLLSRRRAQLVMDVSPIERKEFFYNQLLSTVEGAKEVRIFGLGNFFRTSMRRERLANNAARKRMDRREFSVQFCLEGLAAAVSGGGLLWAVDAARNGSLSVGGIALFGAAVTAVQGALASLATQIAATAEALLHFDRYRAVTVLESDLPVSDRLRPLPSLRRGIELRDVWFRYSDQLPWVLRGVDLFLPHGQALALIGLNGAGKSTLVNLLCRLYDPTRGAVLWDGVDIREIDPAELRSRMGVVFQDSMHYDLTAAENIGLGDLGALTDQSRIQEAARRAGVHSCLAALPQGYNTLLSRKFVMAPDESDPAVGVLLSGGQHQRVALARALMRQDRELMILDEPSSGLDAEAEHEIHASLRRFRAGRTSVLISHRLGAVREADIIVVLRDGRIVEQGSHDELLAAGRTYAGLFTLQAKDYQDRPVATDLATSDAAGPR
ncbi:ABC transporter ATP-binding protein [Streptomyces sp. NBC_00439]|uniref:ABC transporter ATP-binding protein n=1 Tax=Streptomyces sp. NBC_00439 TaxID=2903650 RepID=UPI002258BF7F|nr:ABC transporter ATP-binding protein [Streptomyces sp. NBC_00439]MCX5106878.1 ABC transporter ATP-binding protein/permease [Streptomyces sp. NBC_00439]